MTEHSDVVDRADSLMRRRRSFVASVSGKTEPISAPPPPISDDEDPVSYTHLDVYKRQV